MDAVIERYTCCRCGVTNEVCKWWGPTCPKTGRRICAECCRHCQHHVSWSGIWRCSFVTELEKAAAIRKRIQDNFESENRKITEAYITRRRAEARKRAIKAAKARAKRK